MKKKTTARDRATPRPTKTAYTALRQIVQWIPEGLPDRIAREVALFADRSDVSEETTRIQSHLDQARAWLRSKEPAGRALDFLCQELLREINTTGSKSSDSAISASVVQFKAELERIREQVQNIE